MFESGVGSGFDAERQRWIVEDDLEDLGVAESIDGAKDFVTPPNGAKAFGEGVSIEFASKAKAGGGGVGLAVGLVLKEEPHALLGVGGGEGGGPAGGGDGRQSGEAFGGIAVCGEAAELGLVEEGKDGKTLADGRVEPGDDDGGEEGVASTGEKVVIFPDVRNAEDAFPNGRDGGGGGGARGDVWGASEAVGFGFDAESFSETDALGLAAGAFGDFVKEDDALRDLEVGKGLGCEVTERSFGDGSAGLEHDSGSDDFAEEGIGHGEGEGFGDGGVAEEGFVDFAGRDFFAAAVDHLLGATAEGKVAFFVERADIAGAEPAVAAGFGVTLGVAFVAGGDVVAADDDFTGGGGASEVEGAGLREYGDLGAGGEADGAGFSDGWRKGVTGHLMSGFGHAVGFDDRGVEDGLEFGHDAGREGGGTRADKAQVAALDDTAVFRGAGEDGLMDGGDGGVPGGSELSKPAEEVGGEEPGRTDDATAGGQRGEQGCDETVDVKERHHVQAAVLRGKGQSAADVSGGGGEVGVAQRDDFGA